MAASLFSTFPYTVLPLRVTSALVVKRLPSSFNDWSYYDDLGRDQYESLDIRPSVSLEFCPSIEQYTSSTPLGS